MWEAIRLILFLTAYILISYLIITLVKKYTNDTNKYLRLLILSFVYSLFWGLGIIGSNGDDYGFILPAPNIIALAIMLSNRFYHGIMIDLFIVVCWWLLISLVMLIVQLIKNEVAYYKTSNIEKNKE